MPVTHHSRIKRRLNVAKHATKTRIARKHPHVIHWLKNRNLNLDNLRKHSAEWITGAALASSMVLNQAEMPTPGRILPAHTKQVDQSQQLLADARQFLPKDGVLQGTAAQQVSQTISQIFGIKVATELDGKHLNQQYGRMGKEQHLRRFPGDRLSLHGEQKDAGMAPGLGAWGHFADSKKDLTAEDIMKEKYYVAVQTLYLSNWNVNFKELRDWYQYRKVLVVNPENGSAVVAVIGDAGPARWTGKVFGGSPEVYKELKLGSTDSHDQVLLLFVDDPDNLVPLGPIKGNSNLSPQII